MIRAWTLVAMLAAGLASRGRAAEPAAAPGKPKAYQHKRFSIEFPAGWKVRAKDKGNTVIAESGSGPYLLVSIEGLSAGKTPQRYFDDSRAALKKDLEEYVELQTGDAELGGKPAKWAIFTQRMAGKPTKSLHYWATSGKRGFALAGSAETEAFDAAKPELERSLLTFRAK